MKVYEEIAVRNFDFWLGAEDVAEMFTDEELDRIESALEVEYPNGIFDNELNDLFRFDEDYIANLAGYSSFEMVKRGKTIEDEMWDDETEDDEAEDAETQKIIQQLRHNTY